MAEVHFVNVAAPVRFRLAPPTYRSPLIRIISAFFVSELPCKLCIDCNMNARDYLCQKGLVVLYRSTHL